MVSPATSVLAKLVNAAKRPSPESETELPTRVAPNPLEVVARGTGIFLENLELYAQFLEGGEDLA